MENPLLLMNLLYIYVHGAVAETLYAASNGQRSDKVWVIPFVQTLADLSAYAVSQSLWMFSQKFPESKERLGPCQML